jgi:hypothetical protein
MFTCASTILAFFCNFSDEINHDSPRRESMQVHLHASILILCKTLRMRRKTESMQIQFTPHLEKESYTFNSLNP